MEILLISLVAFSVAILTFFSGFGLGTILAPVMMIFFPVDVAIAMTGVVHFVNNIFKLFLVGKQASREVIIRFGLPAVLAALPGAWLMLSMADYDPIYTYSLFTSSYEVYPLKLLIAILLFIFAILDLLPAASNWQFSKNKLPIGGLLSGFFGGLSGNQGALRSAFLIKAGLSKESFVASAVVVSCLVDISRIGVYSSRMFEAGIVDNWLILSFASGSAIVGAMLGKRLLKKVSFRFMRITVAVMLITISILLALGFV